MESCRSHVGVASESDGVVSESRPSPTDSYTDRTPTTILLNPMIF